MTVPSTGDRSSGHYRADLDGLRAIAVLSVICYHLSHNILPGGFLGVDIFFVLSGFLITSIIWREMHAGTFSIRRFYERRVRRIMPALLLVLFFTTIAASVLLLPADLIGYCRSLIATLLFVANIYFWRDTDYFAHNANTKPLLHTWSLGVEEQFYIFFPLLLGLLVRFVPRMTPLVITLIAIASFALNVFVNHIGGAAPAFFLLPTRVWELGIGAIVALLPTDRAVNPVLANHLSVLGSVLVIVGLVVPFDSTNIPVALPVVVGTAMLILTGRHGQPLVNYALTLRPAVFIGLISYSLYLWHWPVFVFSNYYFVDGVPFYGVVMELLLIAACAYVSWRFVERPFRDRRLPVRTVVVAAGSGVLYLAVVAAMVLVLRGLPNRLNAGAAVIDQAIDTNYRCPVTQYVALGVYRACPMNLPSRNPDDAEAVLLGNSHAQMYAPVWSTIFADHHVKGLLVPVNGCLPTVTANYGAACDEMARQNLVNLLKLPHVRLVILAFTWTWPNPLTDATGRVLANAHDADLIAAVDDLIARLQHANKKVILVGPIAWPGWDVPSVLSRELAFGWHTRQTVMSETAFNAQFGDAIAHFAAEQNITFVPVFDAQCYANTCKYVIDGESLYADESHISRMQLWRFSAMFGAAYEQTTMYPDMARR